MSGHGAAWRRPLDTIYAAPYGSCIERGANRHGQRIFRFQGDHGAVSAADRTDAAAQRQHRDAWRKFAVEGIGLEVHPDSNDETLFLRLDQWHHRIILEKNSAG